jgi:hypothetical protein
VRALSKLEQRALQIAKRHVGEREATGRNDGPAVRFWQRLVAKGYTWLDNQPWCVCFATGVVHLAGKELGVSPRLPLNASSSSLYAWAKRNGKLLPKPVDGCIGIVRRGGAGDHDGGANAGKTHVHTFVVHTAYPNGTLATIEGNFRNSVCWNQRRAPYGCDWVRIE